MGQRVICAAVIGRNGNRGDSKFCCRVEVNYRLPLVISSCAYIHPGGIPMARKCPLNPRDWIHRGANGDKSIIVDPPMETCERCGKPPEGLSRAIDSCSSSIGNCPPVHSMGPSQFKGCHQE